MRLFFFMVVATALPLAAHAMNGTADASLDADRAFALTHVSTELRERCVNDFSARMKRPMPVTPAGELAFHDRLTAIVRSVFYWKNAERGVAFVLPVKAKDPQLGDLSTQVACFYALDKDGLTFQLSQQLAWQP